MKSPWQQRRSGRLCSGKRGPFPQCPPPTPRPASLQGVPSRRTGTRLGPRPPLSSPSTAAPPSSGAGLVVPDTRGVWVCTPGVGEGGRRVGVCRAVPKAQHCARGSANVFILNLATALGSGDPPRSLCRDGDAVQSAGWLLGHTAQFRGGGLILGSRRVVSTHAHRLGGRWSWDAGSRGADESASCGAGLRRARGQRPLSPHRRDHSPGGPPRRGTGASWDGGGAPRCVLGDGRFELFVTRRG